MSKSGFWTPFVLIFLTFVTAGCGGVGASVPSPTVNPPFSSAAPTSSTTASSGASAASKAPEASVQPAPAGSSSIAPSPPASGSTAQQQTTVPAQPSSASGTQLVITAQDMGKTLMATVGTTVILEYETTGLQWTNKYDTAILRAESATTLTAIAKGQTELQSEGRPICQPGKACPQFIRAFKVTISVS